MLESTADVTAAVYGGPNEMLQNVKIHPDRVCQVSISAFSLPDDVRRDILDQDESKYSVEADLEQDLCCVSVADLVEAQGQQRVAALAKYNVNSFKELPLQVRQEIAASYCQIANRYKTRRKDAYLKLAAQSGQNVSDILLEDVEGGAIDDFPKGEDADYSAEAADKVSAGVQSANHALTWNLFSSSIKCRSHLRPPHLKTRWSKT